MSFYEFVPLLRNEKVKERFFKIFENTFQVICKKQMDKFMETAMCNIEDLTASIQILKSEHAACNELIANLRDPNNMLNKELKSAKEKIEALEVYTRLYNFAITGSTLTTAVILGGKLDGSLPTVTSDIQKVLEVFNNNMT